MPQLAQSKKTRKTEVGIYKRKQESKKTRKRKVDQESDQENKNKTRKKHALDQQSVQKKKKKLFFFCFLGLVLAFFYKFPSLKNKIITVTNILKGTGHFFPVLRLHCQDAGLFSSYMMSMYTNLSLLGALFFLISHPCLGMLS